MDGNNYSIQGLKRHKKLSSLSQNGADGPGAAHAQDYRRVVTPKSPPKRSTVCKRMVGGAQSIGSQLTVSSVRMRRDGGDIGSILDKNNIRNSEKVSKSTNTTSRGADTMMIGNKYSA